MIAASRGFSVKPSHDGQHDDVVVVGELCDLKFVVVVGDEIAYLAKLSHCQVHTIFI